MAIFFFPQTGGSSNANDTLSNLVSPTAINQDLLPGGSENLGSASAPWNSLTSETICGGTTTLNLKTPDSTSTNDMSLKTGDASAGNSGGLTLETGTASGTRGPITWKDGSEGTPGNILTEGSTAGVGTWAAPAAGGANTALSNLTTTSINQDLLPSGNRSLGSSALPWSEMHFNLTSGFMHWRNNLVDITSFQTGTTAPSGTTNTNGFSIIGEANNSTIDLFFYTSNFAAGATGNLRLETGNATGGSTNSGNITIQPGTATNVRGQMNLKADDVNIFDNGEVSFTATNTNDFWGADIYGLVVDSQSTAIQIQQVFQIGPEDTSLTSPDFFELLIGAWAHTGVATSGSSGGIEIIGPSITNSGSSINAGFVDFNAGDNSGTGVGGNIGITTGNSTNGGNAGTLRLTGGSAAGASSTGLGGDILIKSGNSIDGQAGDIVFTPGVASGTGLNGIVSMNGDAAKLPTGTSDPSTSFPNGSTYYNTSTNNLRILNGGTWRGVALT